MLKGFKNLAILIAGTILLLLPALLNEYPMIYSDTSTYLASGFQLQPPMDRPMTYGLFIRLFSLNGISLWPVIFTQSFILSWLIFRLTCLLFMDKQRNRTLVYLVLMAVASFSGAGWASCYLIPDIFTPIMLLSALLILLPSTGKGTRTGSYVIFVFATAMHSSHIPFGLALFGILLLLKCLSKDGFLSLLRIRPLVILSGITLLSILAMGSSLAKSKHVFLMGAFIEQGIIKSYLDENCDSHKYRLCAHKDNLPEHAWQFIWEESSPLYEMGGWKETRDEYNDIIRATFLSPKYLLLHVGASLKATAKQLIRFEALDYKGVAPNSAVLEERVESYVPGDIDRYTSSKQNRGQLAGYKWMNLLQLILLIMSLLSLILLFAFSPALRLNHLLLLTGLIILLGILINAWVCGTFANPIMRLGNRMIWLIPAYSMLVLFWPGRKAAQ